MATQQNGIVAEKNGQNLGRITESRIGVGSGGKREDLEQWGAKPGPAVSGARWLEQFETEDATLSIGLKTHRQWYANRFTCCIIKGICRPAAVIRSLAEEGLHPVLCEIEEDGVYAMASIWLNIIQDSVCGSYHEVVISFDVSRTAMDRPAFRSNRANASWKMLYPNFGKSACEAQFLHSLYIDSPISISWGREMQAFSKHPEQTITRITDEKNAIDYEVKWGSDNILSGRVQKRFGLRGLVRESGGLLKTQNWMGVGRFLAMAAFDVPIIQPRKTADSYGLPTEYLAHLWKGLNPYALQAWPWTDDDQLLLGSVTKPTECEEHNAHNLLRISEFRPLIVTYSPKLSAFIEIPR